LRADQFQQGSLAGTARPHDRGDPAPPDIQINPVKNALVAAGKVQIADCCEYVVRLAWRGIDGSAPWCLLLEQG
jgi:hypothetical protein